MYAIEIQGRQVPLCIDCKLKIDQIAAIQNEQSERMINYLTDQMYGMAGLPNTGPRFPEKQIIKVEGATLNNIHIENSQVGVVNTGSVQTIDAAVTNIKEGGDEILSTALVKITEAVLASRDLTDEQQSDALEILSTISGEATVPKEQRRKATIRPLIQELSGIFQGSAALVAIYENVRPIFESWFGYR